MIASVIQYLWRCHGGPFKIKASVLSDLCNVSIINNDQLSECTKYCLSAVHVPSLLIDDRWGNNGYIVVTSFNPYVQEIDIGNLKHEVQDEY